MKTGIHTRALLIITGIVLPFSANTQEKPAASAEERDEDRSDINQMFFQPFLSHNWKSGAGISLSSEMNFNWEANTTTISLDPSVSAVTKLGKQALSLALGPRIP